ncbi:type VII secretion target [Saccharothrix texasensis]|uniref:Excreted virulence factor EspC (Type VII ESX diderm) n=1 Tax=Saccharothrix texasensis TaxID=103734 RepID=A0A3N1HF43_9PSEU|nr:type VII secretion target [Saccharothrix texasensis]ROP41110.1 excreted virulence factor EspC (type VII ESX diderm) [Saccharothrix texasensis]
MAGFEIVADTLEAHSRQLDDLGARLQGAVDAAKTVSMPTDAYGILCQPFRMMLDPVEQYGLDALQGAVEAMDAAGKAVKDTVDQYREMEEAIRDSFKAGD